MTHRCSSSLHRSFASIVALLSMCAACSSSSSSSNGPSDSGTSSNPGDDDSDSGTHVAPANDSGASSNDSGTPPATDSGNGLIVVDAGPQCNALAPAAPKVSFTLSDANGPAAATGGTIADGTYWLTNYTIYGAGSVGSGFTANQAESWTLTIAGTAWTQVQVDTIENTVSTVSSNFTADVSGTAVALTPSCPAGAVINNTYTASDSAIELVTNEGGFLLSELFVKQ